MIRQEFGGQVGLVVGESSGGLIAQYLAAFHLGSLWPHGHGRHRAEVSDWGKGVDFRYGAALTRSDTAGAGTVSAEYLRPATRCGRPDG